MTQSAGGYFEGERWQNAGSSSSPAEHALGSTCSHQKGERFNAMAEEQKGEGTDEKSASHEPSSTRANNVTVQLGTSPEDFDIYEDPQSQGVTPARREPPLGFGLPPLFTIHEDPPSQALTPINRHRHLRVIDTDGANSTNQHVDRKNRAPLRQISLPTSLSPIILRTCQLLCCKSWMSLVYSMLHRAPAMDPVQCTGPLAPWNSQAQTHTGYVRDLLQYGNPTPAWYISLQAGPAQRFEA